MPKLSLAARNKLLGGQILNLLSNGTFASAITGWTSTVGFAQASAVTGAKGSTGYATLTSSGSAAEGRYTAALTLNGKRKYDISYWLQVPATLGVTTGIQCLIGTTAGASDIALHTYMPSALATWERVSHEFIVPADTSSVYLTFKNSDVTNTKVAYVDEVCLNISTGSFDEIFEGAVLKIYDGTAPSTADAAIGSVTANNLLITISREGITNAGLHFGDAAAGILTKPIWETWKGTAVNSSTATFARLCLPDDPGTDDASAQAHPRVQFTVGTSGTDIILSQTSITSGADTTIQTASITMPGS
ncbi:secreted protein containing Carbohydrate-binding, CenC-like domain protein [Candidatus Magnetobacterium bavaricum]|uniref:Secreted protein containing Carbohydrate-binding, CenC-like domain protein n=1 Tax=Candidatus Magnetobacterium bavaricum TaxID=29290 RepID=A0A0F3GHX4_9BACT|nr:secreted protein containing Carbohydrate-binding, CenC-like domain protein [Candidatus Magnetobacterium bavaricum]